MLSTKSGPISLARTVIGPFCVDAAAFAAGADDADAADTIVGVFAATFAAGVCNGGYADAAAAAAFAGGGDGGFAGFGAGDFAGFGDGAFVGGGLDVCFTFDASRRLDASTCSSLGGGASSLGGGAGLLAALAFPVLLDLAFDFGVGSDDGLAMPLGVFFVIRLIAASLVQAENGQMEVVV